VGSVVHPDKVFHSNLVLFRHAINYSIYYLIIMARLI